MASDLTDINYNPGKGLALFRWFDLESQEWITAKCEQVVFFKVSNAPKDWEPTFVVDISMKRFSDDSSLVKLKNLGYGFVELDSLPELKHLHMEGDVVIDMVCEEVELMAGEPDNVVTLETST